MFLFDQKQVDGVDEGILQNIVVSDSKHKGDTYWTSLASYIRCALEMAPTCKMTE